MTATHRTSLTALLAVLASLIATLLAPTAQAEATRTLAWDTPGRVVTLSNGWQLRTTHSPMIEVLDDGQLLGIIELANYPLENRLAAAVTDTEKFQALKARAAEFHATIAADRRTTFGDDYTYRADPTRRITFPGAFGVRYSSRLIGPDGAVVERIRSYMAIANGQIWVLASNAVDPAFWPSEIALLLPEQLATIARDLDEVVKASPLPHEGDALADGMVAGIHGGLDGGKLYLVWHGERQRIQQPRPMTEADVRAAGLRREAPIAQVTVGSRPTGSYFAVVPADGPRARLQLVTGTTIREVIVASLRPDVVDSLSDTSGLLDRVVVPSA